MALGPIAFYSPRVTLEDVRHSGERRLARLFAQALQRAGARIEVISQTLTYDRVGLETEQKELQRACEKEAEALVQRFRARESAQVPRALFTFANSHLSPDHIGTVLSDVLSIPYFIADCSYNLQERAGKWRENFASAKDAIIRARKIFCINRHQVAALSQIRTDRGALVQVPPFTDVGQLRALSGQRMTARRQFGSQYKLDPSKGWLLVVQSMMRGEVQTSFHMLAQVLEHMRQEDWQLLVVGDGPQQAEIRKRFRPHKDRVRFLGRLPTQTVQALYSAADIYVWPSNRLEIASALLDAQVVGLPVVAGRSESASEIVRHEETGYLVPQGDVGEFALAIDRLLARPRKALDMGLSARLMPREANDLPYISNLLQREIQPVLESEEAGASWLQPR